MYVSKATGCTDGNGLNAGLDALCRRSPSIMRAYWYMQVYINYYIIYMHICISYVSSCMYWIYCIWKVVHVSMYCILNIYIYICIEVCIHNTSMYAITSSACTYNSGSGGRPWCGRWYIHRYRQMRLQIHLYKHQERGINNVENTIANINT